MRKPRSEFELKYFGDFEEDPKVLAALEIWSCYRFLSDALSQYYDYDHQRASRDPRWHTKQAELYQATLDIAGQFQIEYRDFQQGKKHVNNLPQAVQFELARASEYLPLIKDQITSAKTERES